MPELAEVETVRRGLHQEAVGRTIAAVSHPSGVHGYAHGNHESVVGHVVTGTERVGKFLFIQTNGLPRIELHLGMSGQIRLRTDLPHTHLVVHFTDGHGIALVDPRRFGHVRFLTPGEYDHLLDRLGPDALEIDPLQFVAALRSTRRAVASALTDQSLLAGVGKIYAAEALFRSGVFPLQPANSLLDIQYAQLYAQLQTTLRESIQHRGTSFDTAYRDVYGNLGEYQGHLQVFQRESKPCLRCGSGIGVARQGALKVEYCPTCQPH